MCILDDHNLFIPMGNGICQMQPKSLIHSLFGSIIDSHQCSVITRAGTKALVFQFKYLYGVSIQEAHF